MEISASLEEKMMNKYVKPEINISVFDCEISASLSVVNPPDYVPGLDGMSDESKKSLNFNELREVTKFIF